jgi:hypothetical protein
MLTVNELRKLDRAASDVSSASVAVVEFTVPVLLATPVFGEKDSTGGMKNDPEIVLVPLVQPNA